MKKPIKNEIIIDVNPETGVTPEQMLTHLTQIIGTIPASHFLNEEEKQMVVADTVVAVWKKMEEGKVNRFDYNEFRSYLFMALTNNVRHRNTKKTYTAGLLQKNTILIEDSDIDMESFYENETITSSMDERQNQYEYLSNIVDEFPERIRNYLRFILDQGYDMSLTAVNKAYPQYDKRMKFHKILNFIRDNYSIYSTKEIKQDPKEYFSTKPKPLPMDETYYSTLSTMEEQAEYLRSLNWLMKEIATQINSSEVYVGFMLRRMKNPYVSKKRVPQPIDESYYETLTNNQDRAYYLRSLNWLFVDIGQKIGYGKDQARNLYLQKLNTLAK